MLTAEMAASYKREGLTLAQALDSLYKKHGVHLSIVDNIAFEGAAGMQKMDDIMQNIRKSPPAELANSKALKALDYLDGKELLTGEKTELPVTDMVEIHLEGGSSVIVRPSGTEPKIKIYYTITAQDRELADEAAGLLRKGCRALVSE
jgi:phosphoglucomutase